jgi:hypothetical protein
MDEQRCYVLAVLARLDECWAAAAGGDAFTTQTDTYIVGLGV